MRGRCVLVSCAIGAIVVGLAPRAFGDEASDLRKLKAEVEAERKALTSEREALAEQRRRVDEALLKLEDKKTEGGTGTALPPVGAAAEAPKRASEAHLDVYGFIQADGIYDFFRVDPAWNATLRPSKIPVNCPGDAGCGNPGESILSVRQSRIGFKGYLPTSLGELKTIFEFDLFGVGADAGNTTMRIRHIWGELGQVGAGQTNSLFMDVDLFPNVIDYWGPPGMVFLRNPQIRWTPIQDDNWKLAVAVEAPGAGIDAGKVGLIDPALAATSWNKYPDLTGLARFSDSWGHLQLSAIVRSLGVEGTGTGGVQFHRRAAGWGLNLGNVIQMGSLFEPLKGDQLISGIVYGYGIANYMNDGGVDMAPDAGGEGIAVPTLGWLVYYQRAWSARFSSALGYSEHRQFNVGGQTANAFREADYMNVNLLWRPIPEMFVGPEFLWGKRKNENGEGGSDSRVQVSFHYDFGGTIGPRQ